MAPLLEVRGLSFQSILRGVSFCVEKGEYLAVVGQNGAGKTTLLRCLDRILSNWTGEVLLSGVSIRAIPLGGYCAFYGDHESGEDVEKDDPREFAKQKLWKRMLTILMGPGANFLLAFVVAVVFFWVGGVNVATGIDPYIAEVMGAGPA